MFRKLTRLVYGEHRGAGTKPFVPKPLPAGEAAVAPGGQSRYLWTDAFGVLNFVTEAARCAEAGDEEGREDALSAAEALVEAVCAVLGRPRSSDLPMARSPREPLRGARDEGADGSGEARPAERYRGLRIGKRLASAASDPGMALDGMYFHYVDKFVFALARLGDALGGAETKRGARIVAEACAVVQDVHDLFVERAEASEASEPLRRTTLGGPDATTNAAGDAKRKPKNENVGIRWKLNVDGTPVRGLPPTRLSSDAVSGAVAWSAASRLALRGSRPAPAREASLARETEDMRDMAARLRPAVSMDPLGWGMQMWESQWVPAATELAERGAPEWSAFAAALRASARVPGGDFASGRLGELPFRAYGAFLGARVGGRGDLAETAAHAARDAAAAELAGLDSRLSGAESYSRSDGLTTINRVMLASALDPLAFRRLADEPCIF